VKSSSRYSLVHILPTFTILQWTYGSIQNLQTEPAHHRLLRAIFRQQNCNPFVLPWLDTPLSPSSCHLQYSLVMRLRTINLDNKQILYTDVFKDQIFYRKPIIYIYTYLMDIWFQPQIIAHDIWICWAVTVMAKNRRPRKMWRLRTMRMARRDFITRIKRKRTIPASCAGAKYLGQLIHE
jgi:hypothetical protein